jgi:hypothetical protein
MGHNAPFCAFRTRALTSTGAYSHAMPCALITSISTIRLGSDIFLFTLGDIIVAQGISVPIFRGGPPLAIE